jgi:hypothetical protein
MYGYDVGEIPVMGATLLEKIVIVSEKTRTSSIAPVTGP